MSKYLLSLDIVNGLSPCRKHEIFNAIIKNSYIFLKIENGLQLRKNTVLSAFWKEYQILQRKHKTLEFQYLRVNIHLTRRDAE